METPVEEVQRELEARWQKGGLTFLGEFTDMLFDPRANAIAAEFVKNKIRSIVNDPETAEKLCPKDIIGGKRLCVDTGYYAMYNQPHVHLLDIKEKPIEKITAKGILRDGVEYEFDSIVYATGYDAITGSYLRIDIRGRNGLKLKDHWDAGPRTYLGLMVAGFPKHVHGDWSGQPERPDQYAAVD